MLSDFIWTVSIVLMALAASLFAWVATASEQPLGNYGPAIAEAYRWRPWLFAFGLVVLVAANYRALLALPWGAEGALGNVQRVEAVAEQWSWAITPSQVKAGEPVEFHVTSKDVNHGFAIYDRDFRVLAETQAMPGYTNVLRYTFSEPGTYKVLCLEYCGQAHHDMMAEINVVAP